MQSTPNRHGFASSVLMISPVGFREDSECLSDNAFQAPVGSDVGQIEGAALDEFDACVSSLTDAGVTVVRFEGTSLCPSAVFPNNWFSTHEDGTLVLYPMRAVSRRLERRQDIIDWLLAKYPSVLDLTPHEDRGHFLEGTGSMVLDHTNRIAYAAESSRTDPGLFRNWCADMEYEAVLFQTSGPGGMPIYHTNVLLTLGDKFAILCTEALLNPAHAISTLLSTGHEIVEITKSQMANFCGNCLELKVGGAPGKGSVPEEPRKVLAMSKSALEAFRPDQLAILEAFATPLVANIPTIERYGGGSVRCMLAELRG